MSEEEKKLYNTLFPNDSNPNYINYAYFKGGCSRSLGLIKSKIKKSHITPIIVEDDVHEGSFFARVFEKDVDVFLSMIKPYKYIQIKIPKRYKSTIQNLFGDVH